VNPSGLNRGWNIAGARVQVLVSSHGTAGRYTICEVETTTGKRLPLHPHSYEDAFFYILEGDFQFQIGSDSISAAPGTSLFIPRQTARAFRCDTGPGRFLVLACPGGLDLFFHDADALAHSKTPFMVKLAAVL
jgi:quercetin dioxygenase-like cupin family protein